MPLWNSEEKVFDCYVAGVDSRSEDDTEAAVREVFGDLPGTVFEFEYDGLGNSRTEVLKRAWEEYSWATHVMFIDPDWMPVVGTVKKDQLSMDFTNFFFKIHDRNGKTARILDWMVLHEEGLGMKYRWHEQWIIPEGSPNDVTKPFLLGWEIEERKDQENWHTLEHADSFSYKRYLFEISELYQDYLLDPLDSRLLYYLGFDHLAAWEASQRMEPGSVDDAEVEMHLREGMKYLTARAGEGYLSRSGGSSGVKRWDEGAVPLDEMSYAALQYLGVMSWAVLKDGAAAEGWYKRCVEFDG
ncbi:hypothetical protein TrRE_jg7162, partial [Triparma retinervis]